MVHTVLDSFVLASAVLEVYFSFGQAYCCAVLVGTNASGDEPGKQVRRELALVSRFCALICQVENVCVGVL